MHRCRVLFASTRVNFQATFQKRFAVKAIWVCNIFWPCSLFIYSCISAVCGFRGWIL